jgi:phosphoglucosamine mutase
MTVFNKLKDLREKLIFFIDNWYSNNVIFDERKELEKILNFTIFNNLLPCVIDISKVIENQKIIKDKDRLILQSRVKVQGTDGIRGVVTLEVSKDKNFLQLFSQENKISTELVGFISLSFCRNLLNNGILNRNDGVLIGEDGRDFFKGKPFKSALINGIISCGLKVYDAGIIPTPAIPLFMKKENIRAGIVLTASHNPSNQNGVKFFIDGLKVLPEGPCGDFAITSYLYDSLLCARPIISLKHYHAEGNNSFCKSVSDVSKKVRKLFVNNIIRNIPQKDVLKDLNILFDPANGSGTYSGKEVLRILKANAIFVNDKPNGSNINQGGGVALLEGVEKFVFNKDSIESFPVVVREMFRKKISFGLALDGDADRVYLLALNCSNNTVYVINGDKISYLLISLMVKSLKSIKKRFIFVNTVESDVMVNTEVENNLKIKTRVACVGDKWLVRKVMPKESLLIGAEESGHIIIPVRVGKKKVYTGNGILAGLTCLSYIVENKLSLSQIVYPFEEGFKKTYYTYLVDKKLFQRGSKVFNNDKRILIEEFKKVKKQYNFKGKIEEIVFDDDIDMLYLLVKNNKEIIGRIFIRNSGTETKTSVNIRCKIDYKDIFVYLAEKVILYHRRVLKDKSNPYTIVEKLILKMIDEKSIKNFLDLKKKIRIDEINLKALLFGMSKEYYEYKDNIVKLMK